MNNRDFYQRTFSQLHSSKTVKWEEMRQMTQTKNKKRLSNRLLPLAAVIALLALLGGTAVAVNFLGLRDALLPRQKEVGVIDPDTGLTVPGEKTRIDVISLSGFADTPESKALAEWEDFLESYDPDKAILNRVGNTLDPELFEQYGCYYVYTREMGDKLEEIARKYDLKLHTEQIDLCAHPEALGSLRDFGSKNETYWTYMYEDGTCHFDGYAYVEGWGLVDVQFQRSVKGSFNTALLSVVDASDYQEWSYQTRSGVEVLLAMGPGKSVILADFPDSFVVFNVFIGADGEMTRQRLEAVADFYDLGLLTPVEKPAVEERTVQERSADSPRKAYALALWELRSAGILPDGSQAEYYGSDEAMGGSQFALCDVDGDDREELILGYTGAYTAGQAGFVMDFDDTYTGDGLPIHIQMSSFPMFTFYSGGYMTAGASHNQGWAGEVLWPYELYRHTEGDYYACIAAVDAWDPALWPDAYGEGSEAWEVVQESGGPVYFVSYTYASELPDGQRSLVLDRAGYEAWLESLGLGEELDLDYQALTEENIQALTDEPLPVYPQTMPAG